METIRLGNDVGVICLGTGGEMICSGTNAGIARLSRGAEVLRVGEEKLDSGIIVVCLAPTEGAFGQGPGFGVEVA